MAEVGIAADQEAPGEDRRARFAVPAFSRLARQLEREQDRWFLWLPVLYGAGVALYFALTFEPHFLAAVMPALAALALHAVWRRGTAAVLVTGTLVAVTIGFAAAKLRTGHGARARAPDRARRGGVRRSRGAEGGARPSADAACGLDPRRGGGAAACPRASAHDGGGAGSGARRAGSRACNAGAAGPACAARRLRFRAAGVLSAPRRRWLRAVAAGDRPLARRTACDAAVRW